MIRFVCTNPACKFAEPVNVSPTDFDLLPQATKIVCPNNKCRTEHAFVGGQWVAHAHRDHSSEARHG